MCDLWWGNPCLLDNPCLWDRVLEAVRGGGQEGSKPREGLSREWGALVAPTEAHCTEGHVPEEGEGSRGSVPGGRGGKESQGLRGARVEGPGRPV